jgi:hypothetical protein
LFQLSSFPKVTSYFKNLQQHKKIKIKKTIMKSLFKKTNKNKTKKPAMAHT